MIYQPHYKRIEKISKGMYDVEIKVNLYFKKTNDYVLRDLRLGKAISLVNPREQNERAIRILEEYFK